MSEYRDLARQAGSEDEASEYNEEIYRTAQQVVNDYKDATK